MRTATPDSAILGGAYNCDSTRMKGCNGLGCEYEQCDCNRRVYGATGMCRTVAYEDGICKNAPGGCIPHPAGFPEDYCTADKTEQECSWYEPPP